MISITTGHVSEQSVTLKVTGHAHELPHEILGITKNLPDLAVRIHVDTELELH